MKTKTPAFLVLILLVTVISVTVIAGCSTATPANDATQNNAVPTSNAPAPNNTAASTKAPAPNNTAAPTNAPAQNNPVPTSGASAQTNISPEQAQKIAEAAHPGGRALGAEADHVIINGEWVDIYEIELDNDVDVAVDMKTGKIVGTKNRNAEW